MATRANIIVQTGPKTFKLIYTHSDGYPSWMGVYLDRFHNTEEAAKQIVALGDMSALDARLSPKDGELHGFSIEHVQAPFCSIFFGRDREPDEPTHRASQFRSLQDALAACSNYAVYVWVKGTFGWAFAVLGEGDEVTPISLLDLAHFVRTDPECVSKREEMDEEGLTLEWRDAGCPHKVEQGKYRLEYKPMPVGWLSETQVRTATYEEKALF